LDNDTGTFMIHKNDVLEMHLAVDAMFLAFLFWHLFLNARDDGPYASSLHGIFNHPALTRVTHTHIQIPHSCPVRILLQLAVQVGEEVHAEVLARVTESQFAIQGVDPLHILVGEHKVARQVIHYAAGRLALWNDTVASGNAPGQRDLRARLAVLAADLGQDRILNQLANGLAGGVKLVLVAKRAVLRNVDLVLGVPGGKLALLQVGMHFELVRGGHLARLADQPLQLRFAKIADADGARLARLDQRHHRAPGVDKVGLARQRDALRILGHECGARCERARPVHQVQVEVGGAEVLQTGVQRGLDVLRPVRVVPQLRGDEQGAARDARGLDGAPHRRLRAVDKGRVNVAVAGAQGGQHGVLLRVLVLPGAETEGGDRGAGVERVRRGGGGRGHSELVRDLREARACEFCAFGREHGGGAAGYICLCVCIWMAGVD
jgi:hypothetical protein